MSCAVIEGRKHGGGGGGRVLPPPQKKMDRGVRPASQNP